MSIHTHSPRVLCCSTPTLLHPLLHCCSSSGYAAVLNVGGISIILTYGTVLPEYLNHPSSTKEPCSPTRHA